MVRISFIKGKSFSMASGEAIVDGDELVFFTSRSGFKFCKRSEVPANLELVECELYSLKDADVVIDSEPVEEVVPEPVIEALKNTAVKAPAKKAAKKKVAA